MATHLHILSEGADDEMFYEHLAEVVTGKVFALSTEYPLRHGANWKTALANARMLLSRFRHWKEKQDIAVIIAVDNDRAPQHPGGRVYPQPLPPSDLKKPARYTAILSMVEEYLGKDPHQWPVAVALAVPVEMIESWVLTLLDPQCEELPPFAEASKKTAQSERGHRVLQR
jgi:hypothetical protein